MSQNYTTLNKDIGLIQRSNNGWDLWFNDGDTVKAEDFHSLQVGIILACLTSWNYLNRYGNPTYEIFGNKSYELLKTNKNTMVAYKIQQYFIECLKRIRRIYEIVYLEVSEVPTQPNAYFVEFEVISINNQLVTGDFTVTTDSSKSTSYIDFEVYMPYASESNPLVIDLWLKNEYGGGIPDEIVYMYIDGEFVGVKGKTDNQGYLRIVYTPSNMNLQSTLQFKFMGNVDYNPVVTEIYQFQSIFLSFDVDEDGMLYINGVDPSYNKFSLAQIINDPQMDLENEKVEWGKVYLYPINANTYQTYVLGLDRTNEKVLIADNEAIEITKDMPVKVGDIHLLVRGDGSNYLIDIDNHIYYLEQ